jgi:hypothetical protein
VDWGYSRSVSIPPHLRKPGAALTRNQPYRGSPRRHASTGRPAIERLLKEAAALLAACPFDIPRADVEAAIDYLASREDFMALLDLRAESILRRRSAGPEDAAFEEIIVDALTVLQERLSQVVPGAPRAFARLHGNN